MHEFFYFWARATFPRFRYDQLMRLGWKVFLPVSLFWVALTAGASFSTYFQFRFSNPGVSDGSGVRIYFTTKAVLESQLKIPVNVIDASSGLFCVAAGHCRDEIGCGERLSEMLFITTKPGRSSLSLPNP